MCYALGFSSEKTRKLSLDVRCLKGKLVIINSDPIALERRDCYFITDHIVDSASSLDGNITIKGLNCFFFSAPLPLGFSGGPTINPETNIAVGLASMQSSINDNDMGQLVVPVYSGHKP